MRPVSRACGKRTLLSGGPTAKLLAAADAAEKHRAAVDAAAKRVLANPNDPAAQQALVAAMKDLDGDLSALTSVRAGLPPRYRPPRTRAPNVCPDALAGGADSLHPRVVSHSWAARSTPRTCRTASGSWATRMLPTRLSASWPPLPAYGAAAGCTAAIDRPSSMRRLTCRQRALR